MKQSVEAFEWGMMYRGDAIENLITTMCISYPLLMIDVLKLGFGDLSSWFGTGNFRTARCGCLVGTFAVAAKQQMSAEQINEVIAEATTADGPDPLVAAIKILYKEELSPKFQQDLRDVGAYVAHEGYGNRKKLNDDRFGVRDSILEPLFGSRHFFNRLSIRPLEPLVHRRTG